MTVPGPVQAAFVVQRLEGTRWVALRAAVSTGAPLLLLWASGHLEWSLYATFGAFASVYGRGESHRTRLTMQTTVGLLLTAAVSLGAAVGCLDSRAWVAVAASAGVAAVGAVLSDLQQWHPPGPMFFVFAVASTGSIPAVPSDVLTSAVAAAAAAAFAVAVGAVGAVRSGWGVARPRPGRALDRALRRHVARSVVAVVLAGTIATSVGIGRPYWAMIAAVVPLAARELDAQLTRALQRAAGTTLGLVLAALLLELHLGGLVTILVVTVLLAATEVLVGRNYALALVTITPLALLMVHLASPTPTGVLLWDRWIETIIGVVIGAGVGYLTRVHVTR
ncbi:FUSC family protein [Nocardioides jiangxiensis]|uniref:FUSC family protein n=1 Tax=Nocardioides jiangxiensis TaxID=3064524 RepID=A0ABT9AWU1_9ACTN|nr:FUSC family protein [Nocardioides sp. WY-20]MDO7866960.1 FUSC family protein [Nocardioides sp. WY-20]